MTLDDSPADWLAGHDVQLEAGINYLLEELKKHPGAFRLRPSRCRLSPQGQPGAL